MVSKSEDGARLIFVYGSLRPGQYNFDRVNAWIKGQVLRPVASGMIVGYRLYSLGAYPALKIVGGSPGDLVVYGDVLECPPMLFDWIDRMEKGADYKPVEVSVLQQGTSEELTATAWLYRGDVDDAPLVESGDWLKR